MDVDIDKHTREQDLIVDKTAKEQRETDNSITADKMLDQTQDTANEHIETEADGNFQMRETHHESCDKDTTDTTQSEDADRSDLTACKENGTVNTEKLDQSLENSELAKDIKEDKIELSNGEGSLINESERLTDSPTVLNQIDQDSETSVRNMGNKLESDGKYIEEVEKSRKGDGDDSDYHNKCQTSMELVRDSVKNDHQRNTNSDNSCDHDKTILDLTNKANNENTKDLTKGVDHTKVVQNVNEKADVSNDFDKNASKGESEIDEKCKGFADFNDHQVQADVKLFIDNVIADIDVINLEDEDKEMTHERELCELKIVENIREMSNGITKNMENFNRNTESLENEKNYSIMNGGVDSEKTENEEEAKLDNSVTNTEVNTDKKSKKKKKKKKKNKCRNEVMIESKSSNGNNVSDTVDTASNGSNVPDTVDTASNVNNVSDAVDTASNGNNVSDTVDTASNVNNVSDTVDTAINGNNVPDTVDTASNVNNVSDTADTASNVPDTVYTVQSSESDYGQISAPSTTSRENVQIADEPLKEQEDYNMLLKEKNTAEHEVEMLRRELTTMRKSLTESHNYLLDERAKHNHQVMMLKFQLYHVQMDAKHQYMKTESHMSDIMANLKHLEGQLHKEQVSAAKELKTRADLIETQKKEMIKLREQNDQLLNAIKEICAKGGMNGYLRENQHKNGESGNSKEKKTNNGRFGSMRDKLKSKNRSSLELNNFNLEKYLIQNDRLCSSHEDLHRLVDDRQRSMRTNETQKHTNYNIISDKHNNNKQSEKQLVDDCQDLKTSTSESSELSETTSSSGVYSLRDLSGRDHMTCQNKDATLGDSDRAFFFSSTHLNSIIDEEEAIGPIVSRSGHMMSMGSMPMLANYKHEGNISNKNRPHSLSSVDLINIEKEMNYITDMNVNDNPIDISTPPPSPVIPVESKQELTPFQTFKTMFRRKGSKNKGKKRSVSLSQTTNTEYSDALKKHFQKYDMS